MNLRRALRITLLPLSLSACSEKTTHNPPSCTGDECAPVCEQCGDRCPICAVGEACEDGSQCASGFCEEGLCRLVVTFGGAGSDLVRGVAPHEDGAVLVTGAFAGQTSFAGLEMTDAGGGDAFVARLAANGEAEWVFTVGHVGLDVGAAVASSAAGNVAVGTFHDKVTVGDEMLVSAGSSDVFVAAFSNTGKMSWAKRLGGPGVEDVQSVVIDANGDIVLAGLFTDTLEWGDDTLSESTGFWDVFIAKVSAGGEPMWARRFGGPGLESSAHLALDAQDNVFACATFQATASFESDDSFMSLGGPDVWIGKLDANGAPLWMASYGGDNNDGCTSLAAGDDGSLYAAGTFRNQINFGGSALVTEYLNETQSFLVKLGGEGEHLWLTKIATAPLSEVELVSRAAEVLVSLNYTAAFTHEDTSLSVSGDDNVFVGIWSSEGAFLSGRRVMGGRARSMALRGAERVILGGGFADSVDLAEATLESAGLLDGFVVEVTP